MIDARTLPASLGVSAARGRWSLGSALLLLVALASPSSASADTTTRRPVRPEWAFQSPIAEGVVLSLSFASNATFFIPQHKGKWDSRHRHAPDAIPGLASDILGAAAGSALQLSAGYLLESSYLWGQRARYPGVEALHGTTVETESLVLTNGIITLIKRLTGRCRPRGYHDNVCDEFDAFPSGHTSPIAAIGGARLVRVLETPFHDPSAGLRIASFGIAEVGTVATGILRVAAGAHSLEDVVVGALVGQSTGVLVALMHPPGVAPFDTGRTPGPKAPTERAFVLNWGGAF